MDLYEDVPHGVVEAVCPLILRDESKRWVRVVGKDVGAYMVQLVGATCSEVIVSIGVGLWIKLMVGKVDRLLIRFMPYVFS